MTSEPGDEAALWAAALAGNGEAFGRVFDLHHGRVFRHVLGLVDGPADADDIASATFLELWRRRQAVRVVDGTVLPWLLVTAGYLTRNHRRRVLRYEAVLRELPRADLVVDPAEEAEVRLITGARTRSLGAALKELRPVDAQLIALTALGDLSVMQAADALGLTAGAARVRLHRARVRLKALVPDRVENLSEEHHQ